MRSRTEQLNRQIKTKGFILSPSDTVLVNITFIRSFSWLQQCSDEIYRQYCAFGKIDFKSCERGKDEDATESH